MDARKSIYWEIYTLMDDAAGQPFLDLLGAKARAGLDVKLVIDAIGSFYLSKEAIRKLKDAGVNVLTFHSLKPDLALHNWWRKIWRRTHRKVLIIDEEVVFIGGVNVSAAAADWYDLHVKISGKIVRPLLFGFAKSYIRAGGDKKDVEHFLASRVSMDGTRHDSVESKLFAGLDNFREKVNFILHTPVPAVKTISPFRRFYMQAIETAKESFNLLTPYYVPDRQFLSLVSRAKRRGVKINIIMPWKTDIRLMQYMAQMFYGISAKAGAAFYFLKKMNHGKAVSSDNKIGLVGSANLTPRSFNLNQEAGVIFSHEQMVEDLNHILDDWKSEAAPMADFGFGHKRGWYRRFKDWWLNKIKDYV